MISSTNRLGLSPAEAAEFLGIHRRYIDAAIKAGELKRARFGINPVILVADLFRWVRAKQAAKEWKHGRRAE